MSLLLIRTLAGCVAWALVLAGTLSIAYWPGDWGHGVCGPWGCGPTLQSLVACHLSWLVVLMPLAGVLQLWLSRRQQRALGMTILIVAAAGLGGMIAYEVSVSWSSASEWQRQFLRQRIGFVIATQIDFPLVELLLAGLFLVSGVPSTRSRGLPTGSETGCQVNPQKDVTSPADSVDPCG